MCPAYNSPSIRMRDTDAIQPDNLRLTWGICFNLACNLPSIDCESVACISDARYPYLSYTDMSGTTHGSQLTVILSRLYKDSIKCGSHLCGQVSACTPCGIETQGLTIPSKPSGKHIRKEDPAKIA